MNSKKGEIRAFFITLLLTVATLLLLIFTNLHIQYPPEGMKDLLSNLHQDSIFLEQGGGEEYVKLGDIPEPTESASAQDAATQSDAESVNEKNDVEADDMKDAGKVAPTQPEPVTRKTPSPVKVKKDETRPKPKTVPGAARDNADKMQNKAETKRSNAATNNKINNDMKNRFGGKGGNGRNSGSPNGNSATGALTGAGRIGGGLVGYTGSFFGRPHSRFEGTVIVRVHVNARGYVTGATHAGGSISDPAAIQSCIVESKKSRFSVPTNRTTEGIGTIVWRFN